MTVITPDDGSGWIKVETQDHHQGLVPASYVEPITGESSAHVATRMKQGGLLAFLSNNNQID